MASKLTIRAGVCEYNDTDKTCTAVPVQGEITIAPHEEDIELGFWSFEWRPLEKSVGNASLEPISLILIAGETKCVRLDSKSGRIFALVFSSDEKYFFWFQEKNNSLPLNEFNEKDLIFLNKLDSILAGPEEEVENEVKTEGTDVEMKD